MTAPRRKLMEVTVPAGAADTSDPETVVGEAPFAGVLAGAYFLPATAQSGANTNSRTYQVINAGQAGLGTTVMADRTLLSGTNQVAKDRIDLVLSATPANLVVAQGDVIVFKNLHVGTGMTSPGGKVVLAFDMLSA